MKRIVVGAVLVMAAIVDAAAQPRPEALFSPVEALVADDALRSLAASPKGVADRRVVGMRLDRLFANGGGPVLLNIGAHEWVAVFERLDADIQGHRAWVGSIAGIEHSHVSFAERDGVVSGLINAVSETYAVRTVMPGLYSLDHAIDRGGELEPLVPPQAAAVASAAEMAQPNDDGSVIDVLLLYTPGLRAVMNTVQIEAMLAQIISDTNTIFFRSGIATRVRLVASSEAPLPETTSMSNDLTSLRTNAAVIAARNALGADLVQLIMNSADSSACGIGYLLNSTSTAATFPAYSIVDYSCVSSYTPAHEMGHNMGSHHAPEDGANGALFAYSYGYKDPSRSFRTVLAYNCPTFCPRIANMSNPRVLFNGAVTGTSTQDNALSINNAASIAANFRQSTTTVTVPGPPTGLTSQVNGLNVTLAWNAAPADLTWAASAASGYTVQVGSSPGVYGLLLLPVGNTTTIAGSGPVGTYYWRVFGTNSAGNGTPSVQAQFTLGDCTPPGAPQNFTHSVGEGRIVTLTWAAPSIGSGPFAYVVDVGSATTLSNVLVAPVGGVTSIAVAAPVGTYFVRVRAANSCASSSPVSNERVIVVP